MLRTSGRRIDISQPFVDAILPEGHRLHAVLEGISRGFSAVKIRKQAAQSPYSPMGTRSAGAINQGELK
ncbi:hypothetical protein [Nocardioides sp. LHG3406-4]|uniref:hypothetical protein n=1 Tax=Nocardioides sp. LHG3406-4 TaxID=2804575 RepID=UPI003CF34F12